MTHIARRFGAALICAFLWLSISTAQAAVCNLIFEAIPSKDAGPIIGAETSHELATKNFANWRAFTQHQAAAVAKFLDTNFGDIAKFGEPIDGSGGFEGKSSPNASIVVGFKQELQGDALGEAISMITAAVGYMLIQDGTVAYCDKPVSDSGGSVPLYSVLPNTGFRFEHADKFARTVYSAIVVANDDLNIGYTLMGERMLMLDIGGGLTDKLYNTNVFLEKVFVEPVSIEYHKVREQPSIYIDNNWVKDPIGSSLLKYIGEDLYDNVKSAQKAYIEALQEFASME